MEAPKIWFKNRKTIKDKTTHKTEKVLETYATGVFGTHPIDV